MLKTLLSSLLLLFTGIVLAANQSLPAAPAIPAKPTSGVVITYDVCPRPDTLVKTDLLWHAPGGWVSYGESFDNRITGFTRAEWIGINVGKVICLYRGDKKLSFPIALEQKHNQLAPAPSGYHWSKDLGGRKECLSSNVTNCPFLFEKPVEHGDIYENLNFFKGKSEEDY